MNVEQGHKAKAIVKRLPQSDLFCCSLFFLAFLAILIAYDLRVKAAMHPDMQHYLSIAKSIVSGDLKEAIHYHYTPMFSVVIAASSFVFGDLETTARVLNILFTALTVFPVYFLTLTIFERRAAFFAAGLFATRFLGEHSIIKAEQLATLIIYLALLIGLKAFSSKKPGWFFAVGLLLGIGFLTKPEGSAYFLAYLAITLGVGVWLVFRGRPEKTEPDVQEKKPATKNMDIAKSGKAKSGDGKKGRDAAAVKMSPRRKEKPLKAIVAPALLVCAGYIIIAGPYLYSYYKDTGRISLNPKSKTLYLVHNFFYKDLVLYKIDMDDKGFFTLAQRIYNEGDKNPLDVSVAHIMWSKRGQFVKTYFEGFWLSLRRNIVGRYLQVIAPWIWPMLIVAGLWPRKEPAGRLRELYLHAFGIIPFLSVPLFSAHFPRFYLTMVPWFAIVLGRGAQRILDALGERIPGETGALLKKYSLPAVLVFLALVSAVTIARTRPNENYWQEQEYRKKVAGVLKPLLAPGCRYMAEGQNPSLWYLMGMPPSRQEQIPLASFNDVIAFALDKNCKYIVFNQGPLFERYRPLLPLLDPGFEYPLLREVFRDADPDGKTHVIYEVKPVECEP